jgi:hypothetical protein
MLWIWLRNQPVRQPKICVTICVRSCRNLPTGQPFIQYEQGEEGSFFFAEEAVWPEYSPKQINVTDRATILNFIIGLNGYTVCTGIDNGDLNNEKIVTVPLDTDETMLVGWITNERAKLSKAAENYLEKLKSVVADHGYNLID